MADNEQQLEPVFRDAFYHQKRKHGKYRVVPAPVLPGPVSDTHAHIQMLPDPPLALARAALNGIRFISCVGDVCEGAEVAVRSMKEWRTQAKELIPELQETMQVAVEAGEAPAYHVPEKLRVPQVRFTLGCHPHNTASFDADAEARLREFLCDQRSAAIGEIGLDFFYEFSDREVQEAVFRRQLRIAHELGFPVALHVRDSEGTTDAHDLVLRILEEEGMPEAGVLLHCYTLDAEALKPWIERDCYVAFGGAMTFRNCPEIAPAAKIVPADRLLLETDAPYMAPDPLRGTTCLPDFVNHTAAFMMQVRGAVTQEEQTALLLQIDENTRRFFVQEPAECQKPVKPCSGADKCGAAPYCARGAAGLKAAEA